MLTKQMGIDIDKPIGEMKREEVLFALAREARADQYQKMVTWPTDQLKRLLNFYKTKTPENIKEAVHIGIDHAEPGADRTVIIYHPVRAGRREIQRRVISMALPLLLQKGARVMDAKTGEVIAENL